MNKDLVNQMTLFNKVYFILIIYFPILIVTIIKQLFINSKIFVWCFYSYHLWLLKHFSFKSTSFHTVYSSYHIDILKLRKIILTLSSL